MNKLKSEKLPIMGSYTSFNFISKFLQGIKYMIAFCSTVQKLSMVFFELEVSTVGRFQNRVCTGSVITSVDQEKESKILEIPMMDC